VSAMVRIGDVVKRRGKWAVVAPTHCPRGHRLGPNRSQVGHVACRGHGGGHIIWFCRTCPNDEEPTYGPPLGAHCTVLDGPALKRLSNIQETPAPPAPVPEPPELA
jgi:hypothetical protein